MQSFSLVQWAALVGAAALIIVPRLSAAKSSIAAVWSRFRPSSDPKTVDTDAVALSAFKTLRAKLGPDLAAQVWAKIQPIEEPKS